MKSLSYINNARMNKLLVICGPTATGKTAMALTLAKRFNGELVNADSRQIYQGLDSLTGKDRSEDAPIWLYDVVAAGQEFSVAHFVPLAQAAIDDIHKRARLPVVVGGTGFYLRGLTGSVGTLSTPPNPELRKALGVKSIDALQSELRSVDHLRWSSLNDSDRKNPRRLIRAIEVAQSLKDHSPQQTMRRYDALWIGLTLSKALLEERITKRVAERFDRAAAEVREGLPPILGADPLLSFARGQSTKDEAIKKWVLAEYQYAKRQLTWFKKQKNIHWFDVQDPSYTRQVEALVEGWYTSN
ncbi:MAG: tRNA dimethylallyltransferase [Candidatus Gottesmanbacteria bacterium GW2011_GWA1_48_13]|uniref:tRNA dimethylallyltransferase n=2 Tax=Candidatus Gottesmaniibacteriota TaxID=1752720 RepID=A0A0G1UNZ0_9BACT|nr:MAG: tRNA dimethylallyltransferase [Candidatus Gottesmanbacteria bacterium GW2011_GWA1_48_13]